MAQNRNEIGEALFAFVTARTMNEAKRIVEEHRDVLLTDAADTFFGYMLEPAQVRGDENAIRRFEERRALLARCRREGIDPAFDSHLEDAPLGRRSLLHRLFTYRRKP